MDWDLFATLGFMVGLLIVYLPQFWKMIKMKSSYGFHQLFMFLGHTASFLSCLTSLIFYMNNWWSCHGSVGCTESFFGFGMIVFQWLLFWIFYVLFLVYLPMDEMDFEVPSYFQSRRMAILFFVLSHVIMLVSLVISLVILGKAGWHESSSDGLLIGWSSILEIMVVTMFLAHYLPQIYETWRLKRVGSLSLITLGLMCPGTFLWTLYLALQPEHNDTRLGPVMVWLPYLIVGVMQLVLLVIGIYYDRWAPREEYFGLGIGNEE